MPTKTRQPRKATTPSPEDMARLIDRLDGRKVVTVDLDATLYDPWACCGYRGRAHGSDRDCTHARVDTVALVREVCRYHDAVPVILSWRGGLVHKSRKWLAEIGFEHEALFIPGSPDDISGMVDRPTGVPVQVEFKLATVRAVERLCGATVVASFDDNADVVAALADHGVWEATQVEHLVKIAKHEWAAGYLGAPEPRPTTVRPADRAGWMTLPFDEVGRDTPPLVDTLGGYYDDEDGTVCVACGESLLLLPGTASEVLCGWCEESAEDDADPEPGDGATLRHEGAELAVTVQALDSFDEVVVKVDATGELLFVSKYDLI